MGILKSLSIALLMLCFGSKLMAQPAVVSITSPDKKIGVRVQLRASGSIVYTVAYANEMVINESRLGLVRNDGDFSQNLILVAVFEDENVQDTYKLFTGKKKDISYNANKKVLHFQNKEKQPMDVVFQVSNDGVAFRYVFPDTAIGIKTVTEEITSFHFPASATAWLQPMSVAKSGWESTNPAYEEHYQQNIPVGTAAPTEAGWVYPALFKYNDTWMLISETALDSTYCGTRLKQQSPDGEYNIGFPDARELGPGNGLLPQAALPFATPWRIIAMGPLKTIVESTLGTDLATPAVQLDTTFIKPGKASWSWIMSKDDSIVYSEQQRYIDFAANMQWQYCLIDVNWDTKIGYEGIKKLADYAAQKGVGLILWYNSSGDWNTTKYTPKSKLLTREDRRNEFTRLNDIGIKGLKIDFFGGDGRSVIRYYMDILKDAADYKLLINFHGATLPRGWQRTYPHLVTTEAVRGFEMVTFNQADADLQPTHCAMLPFTRNAFDPMDFTPMNLYKIPTNVQRKTTSAFELALSVLFLSGIQHFAESPDGMQHVPDSVKAFLQALPVQWDDVQFIEGFPGKYVVLARKWGTKWYIAGINGETSSRNLTLDLSVFKKKKGVLITDGKTPLTFSTETWGFEKVTSRQLTMQPSGGFVLVLE